MTIVNLTIHFNTPKFRIFLNEDNSIPIILAQGDEIEVAVGGDVYWGTFLGIKGYALYLLLHQSKGEIGLPLDSIQALTHIKGE